MTLRSSAPLVVVVAATVLGGCVGDTDPAANVTSTSAKLNAHGHTDDGPATWWWEYDTVRAEIGTAADTEVCGNPHEADRRCGPASSSSDVSLNVTVSGLTPNTTYYFRACGQDAGEGPTCARILSFRTLASGPTGYVFDRKWGIEGTGNGQFSEPEGIAVDSSGNVYVADTGNLRIQKFSSTGGFITKWGASGSGNGQFNGPIRVATDSAGNVYVTDEANYRVQKFSSTGAFITKWGSQGSGNGQFTRPYGVATDSAGNLYTSDIRTAIQKFSSTGTFLTRWGNAFSGDGSFSSPRGVAAGSTGSVFVVDTGNSRVQQFSRTGGFISKFGSPGSGNGQFQFPADVAVDSAGNVYVVEVINNRVQKFRPQ